MECKAAKPKLVLILKEVFTYYESINVLFEKLKCNSASFIYK